MNDNILQHIQEIQFTDQPRAEILLQQFISDTFKLDVVKVTIRPLAVSLNSFNGFLTLSSGDQLFFKSHTEADNVISEYYNSIELSNAGYPVVQPILSSTVSGKQILIYPVVHDPSVFDVAWSIEQGDTRDLETLRKAQHTSDTQLYDIYVNTLQLQYAEDSARAPIHQLFYHRVVAGRLDRFYDKAQKVSLPGVEMSMADVRKAKWSINGQNYHETIDALIYNAVALLTPAQQGPSIIGHGDAHNGNVFFQCREEVSSLLYFDPAFAGRHNPLLDLVKPIFHNVFAMWMYYPIVKDKQTEIALKLDANSLLVDHNYSLYPIRQMFLQSKVEHVLIPILKTLSDEHLLRSNWRQYLKAALFCCPLLTMNLTDRTKFPPSICLLGLSMAIEMGSESFGKRSLIDQILDKVEGAVS